MCLTNDPTVSTFSSSAQKDLWFISHSIFYDGFRLLRLYSDLKVGKRESNMRPRNQNRRA